MIGPWYILMDDDILHERNQRLRDEEIVQAPTYAALAGGPAIRPPGILDPVRVETAVNVYKTMVEEFLHPGALLWQETGCFLVLFGVSQVNRHVCRIEVPGDHNVFPGGMQFVAYCQ